MIKCKTCRYFVPCEDKPKRGECTHPDRNDNEMVHYFGSLKETDYCALHKRKGKKNDG